MCAEDAARFKPPVRPAEMQPPQGFACGGWVSASLLLMLWPADGSDLAAAPAAAEERIAAVGFEAGNARSRRHLDDLLDRAGLLIDAPQFALVALPGAVPELAVEPGHAGDETVGFDGAKHRPGLGIDLIDLALAIVTDPEHAFGPGEPGVAAVAGRRDGGDDAAGLRVDLLDALFEQLKQMLAVEGRAGMRRHFDGARRRPGRRIEGVQSVARSEPDMVAVERDAVHMVDARKRAILADDFGC